MAKKKPKVDRSVDAEKLARRWKNELDAAKRREKDWYATGEKLVKRYRGEEKKRNRYNVFWANTETLRPAYFNTKPNPDVRRRFRDADPLGKAVSEVLLRSLSVFVDGNAVVNAIKNDVFDGLVVGRGVSRIKYVPKLGPQGSTEPLPAPAASGELPGAEGENDAAPAGASEPPEDDEGTYEQVEYEQVVCEHVDWRDFRHGYGRVWEEVPWVGFRHKLSRADAEKIMPKDLIEHVQYSVPQDIEQQKNVEQGAGETEKVAEFWEIWDKLGEKVFFLHEDVKELIYPSATPDGEPPLEFEGFYPIPPPLLLVEDTGSLLPIPPFRLYEEQAAELDLISMRIDKIVRQLKLRGVYDARLPEIQQLTTGDDNDMLPIQNVAQYAQAGGIDKAVAWLPVDSAVKVLEGLYAAREKQLEIIDKLSGVTDLQRGATDPNETYGAQQIKANYSSIRLKRPQDSVKEYVLALMRHASQVMASKFGPDTFASMTDLKFPTAEQKQQLKMQVIQSQQHAALAQSGALPPGAPPATQVDPRLLQVPSWDEIMQEMRSPALRQYRVDVETDSMIAGTLESDMAGLSEVLKAVEQVLTGLAPLVETGALPVDAAKEIVMAVIRRARLGLAVEDAFDKMTAPKPQPNKEQAAQQAKGQAQTQVAQINAQSDQAIAQMREQAETQRMQFAEAQKAQREQFMEAQKTAREDENRRFDAFVKIVVATISATKAPDAAVQPTADRVVAGGGVQ